MAAEPVSGAVSFVILAAACLLVGTGLAWALNLHDPKPPCTAAASSIDQSGRTATTWYPPGCHHP